MCALCHETPCFFIPPPCRQEPSDRQGGGCEDHRQAEVPKQAGGSAETGGDHTTEHQPSRHCLPGADVRDSRKGNVQLKGFGYGGGGGEALEESGV